MKKQTPPNERGIALLFTLILVAMFFVVGMAFMSKANLSATIAKNLRDNAEAATAGDMALENIRSSLTTGFATNPLFAANIDSSKSNGTLLSEYGYAYPTFEAKRVFGNATSITSDDTVHTAIGTGDFAFRSYPLSTSKTLAMTTMQSAMGELDNDFNKKKFQFNVNGQMTESTSGNQPYFNVIVDPTWPATSSDESRFGFRYAYAIVDATGFIDINATRQEGALTFPNANKPVKGVTFEEQNTSSSYANYDLSNIWPKCSFDPSAADQAISNFDELFGRIEIDTSVTINTPTGLADANPTPTGTHHPYRHDMSYDESTADGGGNASGDSVYPSNGPYSFRDTRYSYKHLTAPYSVTEKFPAYDASNEEYVVFDDPKDTNAANILTKSHTRFDLRSIDKKSDIETDIIDKIPYLTTWKDSTQDLSVPLQAYTVAANIKDYIDEDLEPTLKNYTKMSGTTGGGAISDSTVCGNERTLALNELAVQVYYSANKDPYLGLKGEVVWLYGDTLPPTGKDANLDYTIKARVTLSYKRNFIDASKTDDAAKQTYTHNMLLNQDDLVNSTTVANASELLDPSTTTKSNYFVTKLAFLNLADSSDTGDITDSGSSFSQQGSSTTSFTIEELSIDKITLELHVEGELADIAEVVDQPTGGDIWDNIDGPTTRSHIIAFACNDPRNNTHPTTKAWDHNANSGAGDFTTLYNWRLAPGYFSGSVKQGFVSSSSRWKEKYYPRITNYSSMGSANYDLLYAQGGYYQSSNNIVPRGTDNRNLVDAERYSSVGLYDFTGSSETFVKCYNPAAGSNRYMPTTGGIRHEVELGLISRGVPHQTINLTCYNLDTANLDKASYHQRYQDASSSNQNDPIRHHPTSVGVANGGDRQILDQVYIPVGTDKRISGSYTVGAETYALSKDSLNNIEQDKTVYGKININSLRVHCIKSMLMSMSIPSIDDYTRAPGFETGVLPDFPNAASILSIYSNANQFRFMSKFTYDKTEPLSATNAPNDPMRWGSKRWGGMFSHDYCNYGYLHTNGANPTNGQTNEPVTLNDRERETLLMKTKDYVTTRYTVYTGIIVGQRMHYQRDPKPSSTSGKPPEYSQVAAAIPTDNAGQVAREAIIGKVVSEKKFRVELAYDHFLDKVVVMDYKDLGDTK